MADTTAEESDRKDWSSTVIKRKNELKECGRVESPVRNDKLVLK